MNKELKELLRNAEAQGFTIRITRKQHYLFLKNGVMVASCAGTPSDWRAYKNTRSELRRAGMVFA